MDPQDDLEYKRNVRSMSFVLAAIVITIFAAIFISPYLNPSHYAFQRTVSVESPYGFELALDLNSTSLSGNGRIAITAWINNTSAQIENITSANSWGLDRNSLWTRLCTPGWPLGFGIMQGHYTSENYTEGRLFDVPRPAFACPYSPLPDYFLLAPHASRALASTNGTAESWDLRVELIVSCCNLGPLSAGVYTVVAADEWGDVVLTNFQVS
ncbi:MAG: hypothetical protein HY297_04125 [Thaumarchaeota archaeon]|nr:hypothetical protein [Nitrososphaerota archaeon]